MRRALRVLWLAVPLAMLTACADEPVVQAPTDQGPAEEAPAAPQADPAAVRTEIDAVNRQLADALGRGDATAAAQAYAPDARLLPPDMAPTDGRPGIEQFWLGGIQQLEISAVQRTTEELEVFGETAYEQGRYQFTTNRGPAQGKYLVIWKRTPEGWRVYRDIWNPSPA